MTFIVNRRPTSVLILVSTLACRSDKESGGLDTSGDSTRDTHDSSSDTDLPTWDCDALPGPPFKTVQLGGPVAQEDVGFDDDGYLVGGDEYRVYRSSFDGDVEMISPQELTPSGIDVLPSGEVVVNGMWTNEVYRIDPDGSVVTVISGVFSPNGLDVASDGELFITEWNGGKVRRIDPFTGDNEVLVDALFLPNGITLSLDEDALFFNTYRIAQNDVGFLYRLDLYPDGTVGEPTVLFENLGSGELDGMGVDACGNVYVCDNRGALYRFRPDGSGLETLHEDASFPLATLTWGRGLGEWSATTVYFPDWASRATAGVLAMDLGVSGRRSTW